MALQPADHFTVEQLALIAAWLKPVVEGVNAALDAMTAQINAGFNAQSGAVNAALTDVVGQINAGFAHVRGTPHEHAPSFTIQNDIHVPPTSVPVTVLPTPARSRRVERDDAGDITRVVEEELVDH